MEINKEYIKDLSRRITKIFIRYFAVFFIILMSLVSFGQYKDQGKINLPVSISFSFPIACLGATIAALFIGVFRKLEATPPWVKSSEYVEIDKNTLNKGLSKIRKKRRYLFAMLLLWLPYGVIIMALNVAVPFFALAYMATMALISYYLSFSKCPQCNHYFFFRGAKPGHIGDTGSEKLNLLLGGGYYNAFSSKCLNCGLNLKK